MNWMKPNLVSRLAAERAEARGNVSQGMTTWDQPEQLAYVEGLLRGEEIRKAISFITGRAAERASAGVSAAEKSAVMDGWIAWEPSDVLTPAGVLSHIRFVDGEEREVSGIETDPRDWCWSRKGGEWGQITHYRLAQPAQAPAAITPPQKALTESDAASFFGWDNPPAAPAVPVDPYQHLRDAQAAGKRVQCGCGDIWINGNWLFDLPPSAYRIAPEGEAA